MTTPQEPTPGSDAPGDPISMYLQQVRAQQRHAAALGSVPAMLTAVADNALQPTKANLDKGVSAFRASWADSAGQTYSDRLGRSAGKVGAAKDALAVGGRDLVAPFTALTTLVNNKVLELEELRAQYQQAKSMSVVVAPAPEYEAAKLAADAMAAKAEAAVEKARQIAEEVSNGFQQAAQQLNSAVDRIPAWDGAAQGVGGAATGGSGPAAAPAKSAPAAAGAPAAGGAGGPEAAGTSGASTPGGAPAGGGAAAGGGAGGGDAAAGGAGGGGAGGGAPIPSTAGDPALSGLATGAPPPTVPPMTGVGGLPGPGPAPAAPLLPPITGGAVPSTASRGVVGTTGTPRLPNAGGGTVSISGSAVSSGAGSVSGPASIPTAARPTGAIQPGPPPPPPTMPSAATPPGAAGGGGGGGGAPMMPPMAGAGGLGAARPGGGGGGGGGNYDGGSHRSRPQRTVPGVPPKLRGAAGKVEAPQTFLPQSTLRHQDDEEEPATVRLLDEEAWQVESPAGNPFGAKGTATS